nr:anaerobic ribonucleoside-triphosphate reductase activating protein [Actinomycetales bacterium]
RQNSLGPAMAEVRELGFGVALHTAGAYPRRLAEVLPLVDWVGLDIKALPEDYGQVAGVAAGGAKAWDSLDALLASGVEHEVRLTVHPNSPQAGSAVEIARRVKARGVRAFALQNARLEGTRARFQREASVWNTAAWAAEFARLAAEIEALGWETFEAR